MANLNIYVQDTNQKPIAQAEVQGTGTGTDPVGLTGPLDFTKYTSSAGQISVGLVYLDSYNISVIVSAAGYYALSGTVQTGAITGDYNQTFTLTPVSITTPPPPGQGPLAYIENFFASILSSWQSMASSGNSIMTVIVIVVIAIAVIVGLVFAMRVV